MRLFSKQQEIPGIVCVERPVVINPPRLADLRYNGAVGFALNRTFEDFWQVFRFHGPAQDGQLFPNRIPRKFELVRPRPSLRGARSA